MNLILIKRKHFLLLEVLIAFAFVVSAFLPLIYPHFFVYQQQRQFIHKIELDNAVNFFYGSIVEQLQSNQISWNEIETGHPFPVDENFWKQIEYTAPVPFEGAYKFHIDKKKVTDKEAVYYVNLHLVVSPKNVKTMKGKSPKKYEYNYKLFISRIFTKA